MYIDNMINLLNFQIERKDTIKTGRFLLYFALIYIVFSGAFYFLFPLQKVEEFIAGITLSFLGMIGYSGKIVLQEPVLIQLENGISIVISELCTGAMELFIIASAILASHGIEWRKRVLGAIASIIALQAFNFLRIFATIFVILNTSSIETIEFTHNILFRVFLFIVVAGSYIVWFHWAVRK